MLLRDEMFLSPGFQHELFHLLETAAQEEKLCRILYVPPGQYNMYLETGRLIDVGEHWLELETYQVESPINTRTPDPDESKKSGKAAPKLYVSNVFLPTRSVIGIETGESPGREQIQAFLQQKREQLGTLFTEPTALSCETPSQETSLKNRLWNWLSLGQKMAQKKAR